MTHRKPKLRFQMMLVPYLLLLYAVVIPMSNVIYNRCFITLRDTLSESQKAMTEQTARRLDQELGSMQRMAASLSTNNFFVPYLLNNGGYDSYLAQQELNKLRMGNDLLTDIWYYPTYTDARGLIYTADTAFPFSGFFDQRCRIEGENASSMMERFTNLKTGVIWPNQQITGLKSETREYTLYLYPLRNGASISAVVAFVVEQEELSEMLSAALAGNDGYACLFSDRSEEVLLQLTTGGLSPADYADAYISSQRESGVYEGKINGEECVFALSSEVSGGLRLLTATPSRQLFVSVYSTRAFYTAGLLLTLVLISLGCYALAVYNYRPVAQLTRSIAPVQGDLAESRDELETIGRFIRKLQKENHSYQQTAAFHALIGSEHEGTAEETEAIGLAAGHQAYTALLIHMNERNQAMKLLPMLLEDAAAQAGFTQAFCFPYSAYDDCTFAILVDSDSDQPEDVINAFLKLAEHLLTLEGKLTTGISDVMKTPEMLASAFHQAWEAMLCAIMRGQGTVMRYGELKRQQSYNYPYPQEQKLLSAICRRQADEIEADVKEICAYISGHADSHDHIRYMCNGVTQSVVRLFSEMKADFSLWGEAPLFSTERMNTMDQFARRLTQFCLLLLENLGQSVQPSNSPLVADAEHYIRGCFSDPECTAESVAGQMGVSLSHLTRVFKEQYGCTLVQYIDQLRMEKARRTLCETNEKISAIIERCGFANESNFIRKFKKIEGVTPIQYRQLHMKDHMRRQGKNISEG